jgi:peptide/nickel transport system permease protein
VPDSSADTTTTPSRRRLRRELDPSVTSRAEEGMRAALADAAEARLAADEVLADPGLTAAHRDALSLPAAPMESQFTRLKLGPAFWIAISWMGLVIFAAIFCNLLPLPNPNMPNVGPPLQAPTLAHLFGTDQIGDDLFSQVVTGARATMIIGVSSVIVGVGIGGLMGVIAGFYRGIVDVIVVWITDVLLTLPGLILALTLVAFLGPSLQNVIIAIDVLSIPAYARIARATSLAISQRDWVTTALSLGAKPRRILFRDVLPLVALPIASFTAIGASVAILAQGALAYLGIGPPNLLSWGSMIAAGQQELQQAPQATFAPMIVFFITVMALNYIGQRASGALDPRAGLL